jgi:hypothetical protein
LDIDAHRGLWGEYETASSQANFEKFVNKNAKKTKIGGPPWQFFLKPLTPKNFKYGFSTRVHLCAWTNSKFVSIQQLFCRIGKRPILLVTKPLKLNPTMRIVC